MIPELQVRIMERYPNSTLMGGDYLVPIQKLINN